MERSYHAGLTLPPRPGLCFTPPRLRFPTTLEIALILRRHYHPIFIIHSSMGLLNVVS
jgi:hypothetical protein